MAYTSTKMGLRVWDQLNDRYDHMQLADNWNKIDFHDHTVGRGVQIPTEGIADGAITSLKLDPSVSLTVPDNSITTIKLVDGAVTTVKIADLAINTNKLADGSVTAVKLATDAVTTTKILNANVTTAKIADANVTKIKLATDALNNFLKLGVAADRKINWGVSATGSFGGTPQVTWTIAHGLPSAPVLVLAIAGGIATFGSGGSQVPVVASIVSFDATNIQGILRTSNNDSTNNSTPIWWVAIY